MIYLYGGAANERILRDLHVLDTSTMSWAEPPAGGISPGALFGHTAETVGKCVFLFGGSRVVPRSPPRDRRSMTFFVSRGKSPRASMSNAVSSRLVARVSTYTGSRPPSSG